MSDTEIAYALNNIAKAIETHAKAVLDAARIQKGLKS